MNLSNGEALLLCLPFGLSNGEILFLSNPFGIVAGGSRGHCQIILIYKVRVSVRFFTPVVLSLLIIELIPEADSSKLILFLLFIVILLRIQFHSSHLQALLRAELFSFYSLLLPPSKYFIDLSIFAHASRSLAPLAQQKFVQIIHILIFIHPPFVLSPVPKLFFHAIIYCLLPLLTYVPQFLRRQEKK